MSEGTDILQQSSTDRGELTLARLQSDWPPAVRSDLSDDSVYCKLPSLLVGAFPSLKGIDLSSLLIFCRLYAESVFWQDRLIDGAPAGAPVPTVVLRVMLMQAEAYRLLHQMFPPNARFWGRFRSYLLEHASACLEERRFVSGERCFRECTDDVRLRIVIGKNGLARSIVAALVELSGDERLYEPLIDIINEFNKATQLWDDLEDWKDDLRHGVPTAIISRLVPEPPGPLDEESWQRLTARLSREFYYKGHAQEVLAMIIASLDAAERYVDVLPGFGLIENMKILRRQCEGLRQDIERIVQRNLGQAMARVGQVP